MRIIDESNLSYMSLVEIVLRAVCVFLFGMDSMPGPEEMKKKWPKMAEIKESNSKLLKAALSEIEDGLGKTKREKPQEVPVDVETILSTGSERNASPSAVSV